MRAFPIFRTLILLKALKDPFEGFNYFKDTQYSLTRLLRAFPLFWGHWPFWGHWHFTTDNSIRLELHEKCRSFGTTAFLRDFFFNWLSTSAQRLKPTKFMPVASPLYKAYKGRIKDTCDHFLRLRIWWKIINNNLSPNTNDIPKEKMGLFLPAATVFIYFIYSKTCSRLKLPKRKTLKCNKKKNTA